MGRCSRAPLLVAAFLAGATAAPTARLLGRHLGFPVAHAQKSRDPQNLGRSLALVGEVVERVRAEYVDEVNDQKLIENALNGMLAGLDPHSGYVNPKQWREMELEDQGEFCGVGIEVAQSKGLIKVVNRIDGTPAARAGIKPGDLITAIDTRSVADLSPDGALEKLYGTLNSKVTLTIKREGVDKPVEMSLAREIIHVPMVKSQLFKDIGYVRLTEFEEAANHSLREAVFKLRKRGGDKLRGIVLDLRDNPGGLFDQAVAVSDDFLGQGGIVSIRARHPRDNEHWNARPKRRDVINGLPLVVLINGGSASASEVVAGALQDHHRAVLLGTRSFGKGSVQAVLPLPRHGGMLLTIARFYTPSGRSIQGLGIAPDIEVHESDTVEEQVEPERESDFDNMVRNTGDMAKEANPLPPTDLPVIASQIPSTPPRDWPNYDPNDPATDFQLQQALNLVRAMTRGKWTAAR